MSGNININRPLHLTLILCCKAGLNFLLFTLYFKFFGENNLTFILSSFFSCLEFSNSLNWAAFSCTPVTGTWGTHLQTNPCFTLKNLPPATSGHPPLCFCCNPSFNNKHYLPPITPSSIHYPPTQYQYLYQQYWSSTSTHLRILLEPILALTSQVPQLPWSKWVGEPILALTSSLSFLVTILSLPMMQVSFCSSSLRSHNSFSS